MSPAEKWRFPVRNRLLAARSASTPLDEPARVTGLELAELCGGLER
ncbi:MAG: hypothetical protein WAL61_09845 [Acidimicrobiales bacterium]